jgi:UDP-glucose:(heptosyl)LPS alpha-1,3-glucosyltransferase
LSVREQSADEPRPIALVRRGFSPTGGAEKFLVRFAAEARGRGRQLLLVSDCPWPESAREGVPQIVLRGRSAWDFAQSVEHWRESWGNGIVFSFERLLSADCYRAGDGVYEAWMRRRSEYDPFLRVLLRKIERKHFHLLRLERRCFSPRHTRAVIVNSDLVAVEIQRLFGYPKERIHLVRNGLPPDFAHKAPAKGEARRQLGLPESGFVAAFAGTGWRRKGLRFAITALSEARIPGAKLVVAGRGRPPRAAGADTIFLGPVADVRPLLAAADVFILPTVYDPFSNACLEALAMGRPVITTSGNGCSEILREGVNGSVVPRPDDVAALSRALRYWANEDRLDAAADPCRAVLSECSLSQNVSRTLGILETVRRS